MNILRITSRWLALGASVLLITQPAADAVVASEKGFVSLFDGKSLKGWTLVGKKGDGYVVKDGMIVCTKGGGGNLLTDREFENFVLRLDFRTPPGGGNNGIGIRAPLTDKQVSYYGMEIQVIDDADPKYPNLKPWQHCGSLYGIAAAKPGYVKKAGEWNRYEITCQERLIKVRLNGKVVVNVDLNKVTDPEVMATHPGMLRERGRIGFLGHSDHVEFRNIRIKELPSARVDNHAPEGFTKLFNGRDLEGWQGLLPAPNDNPIKRAALPIDQWADLQIKADEVMRQNWRVGKGMLGYVGDGFDNLCTTRLLSNFELQLDWKIAPDADSGVYLRGVPQVQIWDPWTMATNTAAGSGGLFNNKTNLSKPLLRADRYVGEWNRFRIVMQGDRVTVYLNEELVAYDEKKRAGVQLENFWDRAKPLQPFGPIELQAHKTRVFFKNIYVRELP